MTTTLSWLVPSIIGCLGSSIYSVLICCNESDYILKNNFRDVVYLLYVFVVSGIFATICLFLLYIFNKNKQDQMYKVYDTCNKKLLIAIAVIFVIYQSAIPIGLNNGGSIAQVIVNLNLIFITLLLYLFYNKPVNSIMTIGILFMAIAASIVAYGKSKL